MAQTPGTSLGPYEITGTLGQGGMGEVYRGRAPKLERDVAIKVLPESFTADANRVARFELEAKTLAALNHPNIAHVYGLEQADGQSAIVMELVEGPTLADRIEQGPIPADEALGIAMQIAAALEAAHERGIVHRDLKPANIKLRPDGAIKVLDFGIAKAAAPELGDGSALPIMTTLATQIGVILGPAAYMSPEQARGKPVDQRTDIWAFGCVLYEMLTGQLAFGGEDVAVTLARVIANDTDLNSLPATISPAVQRTIELCLRKDPRQRVAGIRDVRLALAGEFETGGSGAEAAGGETATAAQRGPGWLGLAAAALITAVAAAALTFFNADNEPAPPRGTRFTIEMPPGGTLGLDGQSQSLAI
jgi:serine/threonine protein kinase